MNTKLLSNLSFYIEVPNTEQIIYFVGKGGGEEAYYTDLNLYFVYNTQNKQWFSSGPEFFNEAFCKKSKK